LSTDPRAQGIEAVLGDARDADVVLLGEIHDNPDHHRVQAEMVAALKPAALVFEMVPEGLAAAANDARSAGADRASLARALDWRARGWPDFALYAPIFEAAPGAVVYGGGREAADVRAASERGAAAAFGPEAARYGLETLLPADETRAREAEMAAAHCGMLPEAALPGMVEVQRFRDAALAETALRALREQGPPVVVIAGNGHVDAARGAPAALRLADSDVRIFALGQGETGQHDDDARFDAVLVSPPAARDDPCAAFADEDAARD
jgi:uncharacterized iron-regulated protein